MTSSLLRERVWNGKLPICIRVSEPIALGTHEYLLYASRLSYLPLFTPRVLDYFARYFEESIEDLKQENWWFEYDSKPLPWNRPVGLLYDSLVGLPTGKPWAIELKKGSYPSDQILPLDSNDSLLSYWTNQFKESSYIRDGNARAVMLMPREEQETLWSIVVSSSQQEGFNNELVKFWKYADPLIKKSSLNWNVPLRLYSSSFEQPVIQKLVQASETLGSVLEQVLSSDSLKATPEIVQPILHGVIVPKSAILGELYSETMYMDGFLHIYIRFV